MTQRTHLVMRWILYFIGLLILALGIILNTKSAFGVTPIISVPYCISQIQNLNFGNASLVMYVILALVEYLLKWKNFRFYDLLQIPLSIGFAKFRAGKPTFLMLLSMYNIRYNIHMKTQYKRTATTVSFINYHIVFCPRYRRKIFNIPGVEKRFKELACGECARHSIDIIAMECHVDHVHMFVSAYPQTPIPDILKYVKGATSHRLRDEFPQLKKMPSLWTRSYFVSTAGNVSAETIKWYVETQKTRS